MGNHQARVIRPDQHDLSRAAARAFLKFDFPVGDRQRMHELAIKNQEGALTPAEQRELESYQRVGRLVDPLSAKARLTLKKRGRVA